MNIFKNAHTKLALFYMMVAMLVSVTFSVAIFNISTNEIDQGLGKQNRIAMQMRDNSIFDQIENIRQSQLDESSARIKWNLFYFNILILILSSIAGYFLAKKTLDPIEEAMEAQNRFTADASHELRTPLTAMRTEIEVAIRDKKMNLLEARELLNSNLEEISKLEVLSSALLKLAKNDGQIAKEFSKVVVSDVIIEAYEKVESLAREKEIKIECHPELGSGSLPNVSILGDRQSLTELFVILLDNAIKYSPKNSKIKIVVLEDSKDVSIKISDSGIGIKASDLPHIFDRFYRADHSRNKDKVDGYGLGLSIAKQIVDFHGGNIKAESKAGKGTNFVVKFSRSENKV